jgi:hypothetical protein
VAEDVRAGDIQAGLRGKIDQQRADRRRRRIHGASIRCRTVSAFA